MGVEKGDEFEMEKLKKQNQINNNFENGHSRKNKIIAGISVIVIILTFIMGYVVISMKEPRSRGHNHQNQHHTVTTFSPKLNPEQNNPEESTESAEGIVVISIESPESRKSLSDVIEAPKATLENPKEFYFNQPGHTSPNCSVMPLGFRRGPILNTFFTCVRLYSLEGCVGKSTAYYPKIPKFDSDVPAITIKQQVRSIGPCFVNELDQSIFHFSKKNGQKEFQKSRIPSNFSSLFKIGTQNQKEKPMPLAVPDVVEISPDMKMNQVSDPAETFVHKDENGRLVLARVRILNVSLDLMPNYTNNTNTNTNASTTEEEIPSSTPLTEEMADKKPKDKIGYFINPKFSPKLKTEDNTFFQSPWNRKIVKEVEEKIENYLDENPNESLELMIQVEYQNDKILGNNVKISQRPTGFFYRIRYSKEAQIETYYFTNP